MWPKVSIIWLNYNSSKIMPIVLESLESIVSLDYPYDKLELIVVDNSSTDGSFEKIKGFLEKRNALRKKVIRLDKNLGFTGGNNVGFMARDKESRYVLLLNNDAILFQGSLKTLIEYAEINSNVACLQGVILRYGTRLIDSAGDFLDEFLRSYALGKYREYPWILRKPIYVTYVDGSCALYRVENVVRCLGNKLFIDEFFGYGDDNVLGLMIWNYGQKSVAIPEVVASHARSLTFGKKGNFPVYLGERNRIALMRITNTRYRNVVLLYALNYMLRYIAVYTLKRWSESYTQTRLRAIIDGMKLARKLRSKGIFIDIYKAPLIKIPLRYTELFFVPRRVTAKYFENWYVRVLDSLVVE
jgi:GT2 family glycosyltransferase